MPKQIQRQRQTPARVRRDRQQQTDQTTQDDSDRRTPSGKPMRF